MTSPERTLLFERLSLAAAVLSLVAMAILIATSPARRVYDERWHLRYAEHVARNGWIATMTAPTSNHGSAVGPVYPALHIGASAITGFKPPAVRWISYLCLLGVIVTIARSVPELKPSRALTGAASLLAVPFLWPTAGMALTEMPALVPFAMFVLVMLRLMRTSEPQSRMDYVLAAAAGVLLGFTILGRQTYLVVILAIAALCFFAPAKWRLLATCLIVAALVCGWLFVVWRGLVPPYALRYDTRLDPRRIVLSLGYIATATLFINPAWMRPPSVRPLLIPVLAATAISMLFADYAFLPGRTLFPRLGAAALPFAVIIRIAMTMLGFVWLWMALTRAWEERRDPARLFLYLTLFALVAGPAKGFEFSSRYLVGALGVLLLVIGLPRLDLWLPLRIVAGSTAGAASLLRYYVSH